MIRQHDPQPFEGGVRCRICGAVNPGDDSTCIMRAGDPSEMRPEPERRRYAIEEYDTISARVDDLRVERDEAINKPSEFPAREMNREVFRRWVERRQAILSRARGR
jgi:hypothetical protein